MRLVFLLLSPVLFADASVPTPTAAALLQQLRSAKPDVVVDGVTLVLRAGLNRDFMPFSPPGGKPMIGEVSIASKQWRQKPYLTPESLPFDPEIDEVWILKGETVLWKPDRLEPMHRNLMLPSKVVRGGPKLEPGTMVDVVVRFAIKKSVYFLRAPNVRVSRSD